MSYHSKSFPSNFMLAISHAIKREREGKRTDESYDDKIGIVLQ